VQPSNGSLFVLPPILLFLAAISSAPPAPAPAPAPAPDDVRIEVGHDTIERLIEAAAPYEVRLKAGLFDEVVLLDHPRDIRLVPGGVHLRMTAVGRPLAFTADVVPEISVAEEQGRYTVQVRKMPVTIGAAGTYDLASFIKPVPIEKVSQHLIEIPGGEIGVNLIVSAIEISPDGMRLRFRTRFE
jgi:hypothetical protein